MTTNVKAVPGAVLLEKIKLARARRGLTLAEAALDIGISKAYLTSLLAGTRSTTSLGIGVMRSIADFIGVPLATAMTYAEILTAEDFIIRDSMDSILEESYDRMLAHREWCAYMPPRTEWGAMQQKTRIFIARIFERVICEDVLSKTVVAKIE